MLHTRMSRGRRTVKSKGTGGAAGSGEVTNLKLCQYHDILLVGWQSYSNRCLKLQTVASVDLGICFKKGIV